MKDDLIIKDSDLVTLTKMNHIVEVQYMEKINTMCRIKKLDKYRYLEVATGEIKKFVLGRNRQDNLNSLRQTFKKLRYLINNNFYGRPNELHVILTYKENMTDVKRLYRDFDKFMKRLKYSFKGKTTIDYINVVEPQERGAWHCHVLLRFNDLVSVYVSNKDIQGIWRHGFVKVKALRDIDNIGAYLSAYLTDVELNEEDVMTVVINKSEIKETEINGEKKRFIKGGRLHFYPTGMNLFRKSRGIKYPVRKRVNYSRAKKIVGSREPHYSRKIDISCGEFNNRIALFEYNMKRYQSDS